MVEDAVKEMTEKSVEKKKVAEKKEETKKKPRKKTATKKKTVKKTVTKADLNKLEKKYKKEIDELNAKLSEQKAEPQELREKIIRQAAEFENFKKRTQAEFSRLTETANIKLIEKLLVILDDIQRFEKNYSENIEVKDLKTGVDMIFNKFRGILKNAGLKEIEAIGKEFDPELHEALLSVPSEKYDENFVVDEHEKGYMIGEKVVRHSKVLVAK